MVDEPNSDARRDEDEVEERESSTAVSKDATSHRLAAVDLRKACDQCKSDRKALSAAQLTRIDPLVTDSSSTFKMVSLHEARRVSTRPKRPSQPLNFEKPSKMLHRPHNEADFRLSRNSHRAQQK